MERLQARRTLSRLLAASLAALPLVLAVGARPADGRPAARGWRGDGTGVFADARPVTRWSDEENRLWVTPLPSPSNATPVLVGDRLFVMAEPTALLALSTETGKVLWRRDITYMQTLRGDERERAAKDVEEAGRIAERLDALAAEEVKTKLAARDGRDSEATYGRLEEVSLEIESLSRRLDATAAVIRPPEIPFIGYSSASPVTDGESVYVAVGTGVVACYDVNGNARWTVWVGAPHPRPLGFDMGQTTTPVLSGDRLIVGIGRLAALDKRTGAILWRGPEFPHFGTSRLARVQEQDVIVTPAGEIVDLSSGEVRARMTDRPVLYVGPVVDGRRVYLAGTIVTAELAAARAFDLPASGGYEATPAWERALPTDFDYVTEPLAWAGLVYLVNSEGEMIVLDRNDGNPVLRKSLPVQGVYSSLSVAGGLLYVFDSGGSAVVLQPGREYKPVGRGRLSDFFVASPVFDRDRIYLRGIHNAFALGPAAKRDAR